MYLHNPTNLDLPPLVLEKTQDREEMEQSPAIYSFIKSNLLLDRDFHKVFMDIQKKSNEIEELIVGFKEEFPPLRHPIRIPYGGNLVNTRRFNQMRRLLIARRHPERHGSKKEQEELDKIMQDMRSDHYKRCVTQIKRRSSERSRMLSQNSSNHGNNHSRFSHP
jgi:hypothetical protein